PARIALRSKRATLPSPRRGRARRSADAPGGSMFLSALGILLAVALVAATLWGFVFGPMWLGFAWGGSLIAVFIADSVTAKGRAERAIDHRVKKRRRGWGQRIGDQERAKYGSLMVFEPVCLVPGCNGAVVGVMSNGGLKMEPFVKSRSTVEGFYSQG